jgi:hypothetical protein
MKSKTKPMALSS